MVDYKNYKSVKALVADMLAAGVKIDGKPMKEAKKDEINAFLKKEKSKAIVSPNIFADMNKGLFDGGKLKAGAKAKGAKPAKATKTPIVKTPRQEPASTGLSVDILQDFVGKDLDLLEASVSIVKPLLEQTGSIEELQAYMEKAKDFKSLLVPAATIPATETSKAGQKGKKPAEPAAS